MVKIIERHLTDSDVEWLNEPISYNPLSVHALMRSQGLTPPKTTGRSWSGAHKPQPDEQE